MKNFPIVNDFIRTEQNKTKKKKEKISIHPFKNMNENEFKLKSIDGFKDPEEDLQLSFLYTE